ncbi:MAG: response regulator [Limisphaerales bacterium]
MDGPAVCELLRRLPTTSAIPVLMLTAQSSDSCRVIALHAGVTEYLTKPFSPRELVARVRNVLRPAAMRSGDGEFPETPPQWFHARQCLE